MGGNQYAEGRRLLMAAAVFAVAAVIAFMLVWKWQAVSSFFSSLFVGTMQEQLPQGELTEVEKLQALRELEQSNASADTSEAERQAAIKAVSAPSGPDESGFTQEEKMDILNSLNAN